MQSLIVIAISLAAVGLFWLIAIAGIMGWKLITVATLGKKKGEKPVQQIEVSGRAGVLIVGLCGIMVGSSVGLLSANTVFHTSMKELGEILGSSAMGLLARGTSTMELIEQTNLTMVTNTHNIMSLYHTAKQALEEAVNHKSTFDDIEQIRHACVASACTIIIVASMVVIYTLLHGRNSRGSNFSWSSTYGTQACIGVILCALLQCIIWSGSGLHSSISVLSADLCEASDNLMESLVMPISLAAHADSQIVSEYVDYFAYCNRSAPFASAFNAAHSLVTDLEKKINESIANHELPV